MIRSVQVKTEVAERGESHLHAIKPLTREYGTSFPSDHYDVFWAGEDPLGKGSTGKKMRKIHCVVAGNPIIVILFLPILLNQKAGIFRRNPVQSAGERPRTRDKIHRLIGEMPR